jgi:putative colanic acid biosynthesis acetyltransferase WcaF
MEKTTRLDQFNNDWYKPGPSWARAAWYIVSHLFFMSGFPFMSVKRMLLRIFGAKVGVGVTLKPHVNIKYPWKLVIGNHVWIGEQVWIDNLAIVTIGDHACISQGAMLLCGNHNYKRPTFDLIIGKIHIDAGAWIGAKCIVCPGVFCGSHSVLTVGSVATGNLQPYGIYQGNPAIKIKERVIQR